MPTIVFACKSNSCRSQMAEGWARNWLQRKKDDIDLKLQLLMKAEDMNIVNSNNESKTLDPNDNDYNKHYDENNSSINDSIDCNSNSNSSSSINVNVNVKGEDGNNQKRNQMKKQKSLLESTIIASVALDASAVFEKEDTNTNNTNSNNTITDTSTMLGDDSKSKNMVAKVKRRKHVKAKAVNAMAEDGVDIGSYVPKTLDEILPLVNSSNETYNPNHSDNNHNDHLNANNNTTNNNDDDDNNNIDHQENIDTVDKLIVLCSCGDELKHKLTRRSKSVEEWNIDAPTAAAKNGEGDAAYRRVSLELKNEVTILMESLIGDAM